MSEYDEVLAVLRAADRDVARCVRVGSRVYGTHHPGSDRDYFVVLRGDAPRDLRRRPGIDVVVHSERDYVEALAAQRVFALEARFAPAEHVLADRGAAPWRLDRRRLHAAATERSDSDWAGAERLWAVDPERAARRLFHALRVPAFAAQVAEGGRIADFGEPARTWWEEIRTAPTPEPLFAALGPARDDRLRRILG